MRTVKNFIALSIFYLCFGTICASAQPTGFSYQGRLTDGSAPANGAYSMQFKLFDADTGGAQRGPTLIFDGLPGNLPAVQVVNGVFLVQLDFGLVVFSSGADRYLEVSVFSSSASAYVPLNPRQRIVSTPYSIRAVNSGNAELLGGQPPSAFATSAQFSALQAQNALLIAQLNQLQTDLAATTGGTQLWSRAFGSTSADIAESIAVDGDGNVFVVGSFQGTVDFGGGGLSRGGVQDVFVVKYSGTTGAHLWSKRFGSVSPDGAVDIAVDSSGDVFVTGYFNGTVDFGGPTFNRTSNGQQDIFLLKLSGANGNSIWVRSFGGTSNDRGTGLVADGPTVVITGFFRDTVDFGGLPITSAGSDDIFVAKYNGSTSAQLWSKGFGGSGRDQSGKAATAPNGDVYVTGYFSSTSITFGGLPLSNAGGDDVYLAKLAAGNGSHILSGSFGGSADDVGSDVAVGPAGSVFLTGYFASTAISLGGTSLTNAGGKDGFVVKYDSTTAHQWSKAFGGSGDDAAFSLTVDAAGNPAISGYFFGTTNFGGALLNSAGDADILVAKYSGVSGAHQWSRRFGGTLNDLGLAVASDGSGDVFLTGEFHSSTIDFGGGPLSNVGLDDIFIAKLKK